MIVKARPCSFIRTVIEYQPYCHTVVHIVILYIILLSISIFSIIFLCPTLLHCVCSNVLLERVTVNLSASRYEDDSSEAFDTHLGGKNKQIHGVDLEFCSLGTLNCQ